MIKLLNKKTLLLFLIILLAIILRFPFLDRFPPSLYSDEVNQGYNAYSVLKTGRDEHGVFLPISFRSFGDWKPPLPTYILLPTVAAFGLNEYSVRLPSAFFGVFSIFLSYLLVLEIMHHKKEKTALLTAFLLTISPWHIHQSRSAMLIIFALFFLLAGVYFFLLSLRKQGRYFFLSIVSFALAVYSYYGMRLIVPLFFLFLIAFYYRKLLLFNKKDLIIGLVYGLIFSLPFLVGLIRQPDVLFGRARNVSVFHDPGVRLRQTELLAQDGVANVSPTVALIFHNKFYMYGLDIAKRFFEHLEGDFLFLTGDTASPFRIPRMGVLYLIEAFLLSCGLFFLLRSKEKFRFLILIWLILGILPGALSFLTPTHNRTFNAVFPFCFLSSYGLVGLLSQKKLLSLKSLIFVFIYLFSFYYYLVSYCKLVPKEYGAEWLFGYKELNNYLNREKDHFDKIIFLQKTGMSYIYLLFYNQYPPQRFQEEAVHNYKEDNLGFEYVKSFDKYIFFQNEKSWETVKHQMEKGELYVGRAGEIPLEYSKYEIFYPDNSVAFRVTYL